MSDQTTVPFNIGAAQAEIIERLNELVEQRQQIDLLIAAERGKLDLLAKIARGVQDA